MEPSNATCRFRSTLSYACMVLTPHCCRYLDNNELTGTIPDSLGNLKSLQYL